MPTDASPHAPCAFRAPRQHQKRLICKSSQSLTCFPTPNTRDVLILPMSASLKPEVHAVCKIFTLLFIYFKLSTNEDSNSSVPLIQFSRPQLVLSLIFRGGVPTWCSTLRGTDAVLLVRAVGTSPHTLFDQSVTDCG